MKHTKIIEGEREPGHHDLYKSARQIRMAGVHIEQPTLRQIGGDATRTIME